MSESRGAKGAIRLGNFRVDMHPDGRPEPHETQIAVDRTHPVLGNRHILRRKGDLAERNRVCDAFERDLEADCSAQGPMWRALRDLAARVLAGERIVCMCHCLPSRCHGEAIVRKVRQMAAEGG